MKSKLTKETIDNIAINIHKGHFIDHACRLSGITKKTYYLWLQRGEAEVEAEDYDETTGSLYGYFYTSVKKAEVLLIDHALEQIRSMSTERKSWEAWFRLLESRFPDYFRREMTVVHDNELFAQRIGELVSALRQPLIKTLPNNETLALPEAKPQ